MIITGGRYTRTTVSQYSPAGHVSDLPSLNVGRWYHACGTFVSSNFEQVYLVTGGTYLSSTEVLTAGGDKWTFAGELPHALRGIKAVSINNVIIATGGEYKNEDGSREYYDGVVKFDGNTWEQVGKLEVARRDHGMSVISVSQNGLTDFFA